MKAVEQLAQRSRALTLTPSLSLGVAAETSGGPCVRLENPLGISLTVALKRARRSPTKSGCMRRYIRVMPSPNNWQKVPRRTVCNTVAPALLNSLHPMDEGKA